MTEYLVQSFYFSSVDSDIKLYEVGVYLKSPKKKIADFLRFEDGAWYCQLTNKDGVLPDYILLELGTKLKKLNDDNIKV